LSGAGVEPDRFPAGKRQALNRRERLELQLEQLQCELQLEPEQLQRPELQRPQQRERPEQPAVFVGRRGPDLRGDGDQRQRRPEEPAQSPGDHRRHGIADVGFVNGVESVELVQRIEPFELVEPVQLVELFELVVFNGSVELELESADERAEPAENHGQEHRENLGHLLGWLDEEREVMRTWGVVSEGNPSDDDTPRRFN
jgi:hypothetical protein